ncbi:MAG TPA: ABC-type transport auxiliary lipoprotein family protein, partial [Casimicrobiaceae bacterium]|nr:ABC-type transport auxiliary lipoprotein family protein [Casimicrobiaceae bacterium]
MIPRQGLPAGRRRFALLALTALLAGCAALQPPKVEDQTRYVLAAKPLPQAAGPRHDLVVEITQPRAWPGFGTAQIAYVMRPYELDYYAASRWADVPARMLQPLLARALEQTGSFRSVIRAPGLVPADVRLDTELVRLQ